MGTEEVKGNTSDNTKDAAILIVENEPLNAKLVESFLKGHYTYETVEDGHQALEITNRKKYSLILMDINLGKGMSGLEVTKRLRENEYYSELPIIAMTAFAMIGDKKEFLKEGCTDYISKPFVQKDLLILLSRYLTV